MFKENTLQDEWQVYDNKMLRVFYFKICNYYTTNVSSSYPNVFLSNLQFLTIFNNKILHITILYANIRTEYQQVQLTFLIQNSSNWISVFLFIVISKFETFETVIFDLRITAKIYLSINSRVCVIPQNKYSTGEHS